MSTPNNSSDEQNLGAKGRRRRKSRRKSGRGHQNVPTHSRGRVMSKPETPLEKVKALFVACARCSYFLTGYHAMHGLDHLTSVADPEQPTLRLKGDYQTRLLLHKSYGGRSDVSTLYYSIQCPECRRSIEFFGEDEGSETEPRLQIQVHPALRS